MGGSEVWRGETASDQRSPPAARATMRWTTSWEAGGEGAAAAALRAQPAQAPPPPAALLVPPPPAWPQPSGQAGLPACAAAAAPTAMVDARRAVHLPPSHRQRGGRAMRRRPAEATVAQPIRRQPLQPAQLEQPQGRSDTQAGCGPQAMAAERQRSRSGSGQCSSVPGLPPVADAAVPSPMCEGCERQAAFLRFRQQREQRVAAATLIQAHLRQAWLAAVASVQATMLCPSLLLS